MESDCLHFFKFNLTFPTLSLPDPITAQDTEEIEMSSPLAPVGLRRGEAEVRTFSGETVLDSSPLCQRERERERRNQRKQGEPLKWRAYPFISGSGIWERITS